MRRSCDRPQGRAASTPPPEGGQETWGGPAFPGEVSGRREDAGAREQFETGSPDVFFNQLAAHWKRHYAGWTAWVLSPDAKLPQAMRLKESRRVPMFNGPIECRLFRFDLVAGSNRAREAQPPAAGA